LVGVFLPLVFAILIIFAVKSQLGGYLLSIFEKKTIDNLTTYHLGAKRSVNAYFIHSVSTLEAMGKSEHFFSPVIGYTSDKLKEELHFQLLQNPQFLTLGTTDAHGIVKSVVSREPVVEKLLGQNLSDREYIKQVMKTGTTYISSPIVGTQSKITQIAIAVPLFQSGKIVGVLAGFISLQQITNDMNVSNEFYDKYSLLTEADGTVLTGSIPKKDTLVNISKKEPAFDRLASSSRRSYIGDDYNYLGERVLVMGEKISVLPHKDIFLFCYLKKSGYDIEKEGLNYTINKLVAYLTVAWIVLSGIVFVVLSLFFYRHDKK
jgi:hypothetical protein